jgi:hypothetical protein
MSWKSQRIRDAVKNDGFMKVTAERGAMTRRALEFFAEAIKHGIDGSPFLKQYLGPEVLLVPIPRSAPLKDQMALWVPRRICEEFVKVGLGGAVLPLLRRTEAVQKAAFARPGERPTPATHSRSIAVDRVQDLTTLRFTRITLVDDFVTRGATFLGMQPVLARAFPKHQIRCFALVRTESFKPITGILHPVEGTLSVDDWGKPSCTVP